MDTVVSIATFAATLMILVGGFQVIQAVIALYNDTIYVIGDE